MSADDDEIDDFSAPGEANEAPSGALFGDEDLAIPAPATPSAAYQVLARKYRPRSFRQLVGQEAMVQTLANAFAANRIAHAFMLTGVRGIGKTTTARLLARALNYENDDVRAPSIVLDPPGRHCQAIMESRHPDVMEMDAASRTGINDIREILEGVHYAPLEARTKVYIIDEVHMLSNAAFNGLLKTLEEPPAHVKFIFATTEIRKVPVTVLSRCQRFDLRRLDPVRMTAHLAQICAAEHVEVEADGLQLIARAAEGSVRDALSLLDQAIVQNLDHGAAISAEAVRDMLGLADRGQIIALFAAAVDGEIGAALDLLRAQYDRGADPLTILRDLLEVAHECARAKILGAQAQILGSADWAQAIGRIAQTRSAASLARLWSILLQGADDANRAPDPLAAVEMAVIRAGAAASLPPPEDAARLLALLRGESAAGASAAESAGAGVAQAPDFGPAIARFEDLLAMAEQTRAIDLKLDLERNIRLIAFSPGYLTYQPTAQAPEGLKRRLAASLKSLTGASWRLIEDFDAEAPPSIAERRLAAKRARDQRVAAHPTVAALLRHWPQARIIAASGFDGEADERVIALTRARSGAGTSGSAE